MTGSTTPEARPEWGPVAKVVLLDLPDGKKAKVLRVLDERFGKPEVKPWIVTVADGTPLYGPAVHTEMLRAQESERVLRKALERIRAALHAANEDRDGPINDTIWMLDGNETLFDAIDAALEEAP